MNQYAGLENKKILVVEDVELNQFLARHIMESWGCEVEIAENGALALERIQNDDFDLVLMDIQMPVMDGIQATRQIREMSDQYKSSIPIVALTANAMRSDFEVYLNAGMNDCLPKPFQEPALFKAVSKNVRKTRPAPAPAPPAPEPEVSTSVPPSLYDLTLVEAISGGDKAFIAKMLRLFLDTVPASLHDLRSLSAKQQWADLGKAAHKLKSTIDSMGIGELKPVIREIESTGKTGTGTDAAPALVEQVVAVMERVMEQVKKDHSL